MIAAQHPRNEEARLQALEALNLLDTAPEPAFEGLVQLAAMVCDTRMAAITLVDRDRQWFKASVNIGELRETPRDISFCSHAILQEEPFVVDDAAHDERFFDNPLVAGGPRIRFYAGERLLSRDGHAIGVLCVLDEQPRSRGAQQAVALRLLAAQVSCLLELRAELALRAAAEIAANDQRRAAEQALVRAECANRSKDVFLACMSHELRTPLNAIIGFAAVIRRKSEGRLTEVMLGQLERITANGMHLLEIIDGILGLARVEAGRDALVIDDVDVNELAREVSEELQGTIIDLDASEVLVLSSECMPGASLVRTDRLCLKQILLNLVGNSLKFTSRGRVTIRVQADADGAPYKIIVEDTGIGIPQARLEAVFEKFEQADHQTGIRYGGAGLGLAISRAFAVRLGYRISVSSQLGVGSTFTIELNPLAATSTCPTCR